MSADLKMASAVGTVLGVTMQYSKPVLDRARYALSRGIATPDEQRAASALLEGLIGALSE